MKKLKLYMSAVAMLSLTFLSASAEPEWMSEVYGLSYAIENNSDMVLSVRFSAGNPDYIDEWKNWDEYVKMKKELGKNWKNPKSVDLEVDLKAGGHEQKDIQSFGKGTGSYKIYVEGKEVAGGPMGAVISVLSPVEWHDMMLKDFDLAISLDSTYDESTKTAKFKFILTDKNKEGL